MTGDFKKARMDMDEQQAKRFNIEREVTAEESPDEKLREDKPIAPQTPGAESAESEIKEEKNLNSE